MRWLLIGLGLCLATALPTAAQVRSADLTPILEQGLQPGAVTAFQLAQQLKTKIPVLTKVPNTALWFRPPGGPGSTTPIVWILGRDGRPVAARVTLGITDGTSTEIVRGDLEAGQAVLIGRESAAPTTMILGAGFRL